ncbi:MAG: hypothetical protein FJ291_26850 [Planctomycetes bacterium]|nr:hypothetical protein [Planctomycetota bacterium]
MLTWLALLAGCRQGAAPLPDLRPPAQPRPEAKAAERPKAAPDPLSERGSFAFDGVPLPEAISRLAKEAKIAIAVSPTVPVAEWSQHRVSLRMADVSGRAFLDWLVRPLQAHYALEGEGRAWLCRRDDLLDDEPLEVRSCRVPTHLTRPASGALVFEREQAAVVETLQACLRYVLERRPGCHVAFLRGQDVLVARLPGRGHARLAAVLDAMRRGSPLPGLPRPSLMELKEALDAPVAWDTPPGPANRVLFRIAEAAKVNLGWDASALATRLVAIPPGKHTLRAMLDAVVRQTPIGRYELEPGHGIWLHLEGQDASLPASGATPWDRATVQAYEVRPILLHLASEALLAHLRKQVDPNDWGRGLPAAAVFLPTGRLIVVHDDDGQRRVAAVVRDLIERYRNVPAPTKGAK